MKGVTIPHSYTDSCSVCLKIWFNRKKINCQFPFCSIYRYVWCNKKKYMFQVSWVFYRTTTTLSTTPEESTCPQYNTPIHMTSQNFQYHGHLKSLCRRSICPRHSLPEKGPCSCSPRTWPIANDTPTTTIFAKVTWILMIGSRSCQKVQMK